MVNKNTKKGPLTGSYSFDSVALRRFNSGAATGGRLLLAG